MNYNEKTIKKDYIYQGKIINLRKDTVILPNQKTAYREIVEHPGGVCCLAVTKDKKILFVKQFRIPYNEVTLELPAGKREPKEDEEKTIIRELYEEVGAEVKTIEKVGIIYPSPGYTNEIITLFYTEDFILLQKNNLEEDEFLDYYQIDIKEVYEMIDRGEIVDAKTLILLLKYKERLLNEVK